MTTQPPQQSNSRWLPPPCSAPTSDPTADRFKFAVDPALARKLRDDTARLGVLKKRRDPHPRNHKSIAKLNERIDAALRTLQCPCPSLYSAKQAEMDKQEIRQLWRKRRSRQKLTSHEDAQLAHVNARYWAFGYGPESRARARLRSLRTRQRKSVAETPFTPWEKGEMIILATIHPPLTPEVNIDEALLEQESVFSDCEYDADGIPVDPAKRSLDSMQAPDTLDAAWFSSYRLSRWSRPVKKTPVDS
jgi:hypothetical protein